MAHDTRERNFPIHPMHPSLAFPRLNKPWSPNSFLHIPCFSPPAILPALCWSLSFLSTPCLQWSAKTRPHVQRWSPRCWAGNDRFPQPAAGHAVSPGNLSWTCDIGTWTSEQEIVLVRLWELQKEEQRWTHLLAWCCPSWLSQANSSVWMSQEQ